MECSSNRHAFVFLFWLVFLSPLVCSQLYYNFYDTTCPSMTRIVRYNVFSAMANETRIAASLLRLHFHDCFVNGCDGSVLLDDTSTLKGEKNALPNRNSIRGFEVIDKIKSDLEVACPSTVSCADILALAAREAVNLSRGPFWPVPLGRRDGTTASESEANNLPSPFESIENITAKFISKGLEVKDVAVLSGAHTFGFAQCFTFKPRLFNFGGSGQSDPSLDTSLHKNIVNNAGLLQSDQALLGDNRTASFVNNYSKWPLLFFRDFAVSVEKMGRIGVLTGQQGQIRKNCRVVN
ncbi:PREDICTED: peroxidase 10 isoform X2 [Lupinus angustifolius]|uniref:peroxidase 10 isoform X2 n=1 Tax=Lupinus angustifolius TaxID=3871 RepID=UPI00092EC94F|nr:PREDICTED: peroxidase 10 isoform X2 [Lupinus angustifolius]